MLRSIQAIESMFLIRKSVSIPEPFSPGEWNFNFHDHFYIWLTKNSIKLTFLENVFAFDLHTQVNEIHIRENQAKI